MKNVFFAISVLLFVTSLVVPASKLAQQNDSIAIGVLICTAVAIILNRLDRIEAKIAKIASSQPK